MHNKQIASMLEQIAYMLELDERKDRFFEIRAYRKAALTIGTMQEEVEEIFKKGGISALLELQGVGQGIAKSIQELLTTGKMEKFEDLKEKYPIDFENLMKIPNFGAKRAFTLYKELGIKDVNSLKAALDSHKIRELKGFGEKSEAELAKGMQFMENSEKRMPLGDALPIAESIIKKIRGSGLAENVALAGSSRRWRETVGDLDILIVAEENPDLTRFLTKMEEVESVIVSGPTKVSVRLTAGLSCDFRVIKKSSFGAALQYFTGSKNHGVEVRKIAVKKGYSLNEYQLSGKEGKNLASETEEEIYNALGLQYVEPEMREAHGEVELAQQGKLPKLVERKDITADLHLHSKYTDGADKIIEMATHAAKLGYEYMGMTDHSKSERQARGMNDEQFAQYFSEIDKVNDELEGKIKVLKSGEIDILKDGSLDLLDKTMDMMDYTLCSIHNNLEMPKEEMTKRVITAIESGYVNILAHPTARLINEREPIAIDLDKVFEAAEANNVALEINAFPSRLDLNDENIFKARKYKVKFAINTDSHRQFHMDFMKYGIGTARRGWLEKSSIINTFSMKKFLSAIK